jgi:hypothetical protein
MLEQLYHGSLRDGVEGGLDIYLCEVELVLPLAELPLEGFDTLVNVSDREQ